MDHGYFLVAHPQSGPRKSSPGPLHNINTEINTVTKRKCKRKAGYFFVAHPVFIKYLTAKILYVALRLSNAFVLTFEPFENKFEIKIYPFSYFCGRSVIITLSKDYVKIIPNVEIKINLRKEFKINLNVQSWNVSYISRLHYCTALLVGRSLDLFPVVSLVIFSVLPRQNHVPWGRLSLWKWVLEISHGVKAAGAFGWRTTSLVVPKRQEIRGLNLPGTPWATSACRGRPLLYSYYYY